MKKENVGIGFVLELAKTQAMLSRRLDSALGGLGLSEFIILSHLSGAKEEKLRRIDLAGKLGLTASGVTRMLLPMEKIGLVKSGESEGDARARYVMIAPGGKRKLEEGMERMELFVEELFEKKKKKDIQVFSEFLVEVSGRVGRM